MSCNYPTTIDIKLNGVKTGVLRTVPCGQCLGCRMERARQWAARIMHEAQCHNEACFLTLTYDDKNLPENSSLDKTHVPLFIKRLRKSIEPVKIRYFQCGEYGEDNERPHYHMILFGWSFPDKKFFTKSGENNLYISEKLTNLWGLGFANIGSVTFDSARYVAKYCVDKLTGDLGKEAYDSKNRIPPFVTMSRRPGIGALWYNKFKSDVYPHDEVIVNSASCRPPRYYDRLLEAENPQLFNKIKEKRVSKAELKSIDDQRLRDREVILKQKTKKTRNKV